MTALARLSRRPADAAQKTLLCCCFRDGVVAGFASVLRFRGIRASPRGLIAAPWTPASHLPCSRGDRPARLFRPWPYASCPRGALGAPRAFRCSFRCSLLRYGSYQEMIV